MYGANEFRYARPVADALVDDTTFRSWFISQTRFSPYAASARLLHQEQMVLRTPGTQTWWRSHFAGKRYSYFSECGDRETDLLAIFATESDFRFALHVEFKAPADMFRAEQATDYRRRAACWMGRDRAPERILPHDAAATVICCDQKFRAAADMHVALFDSVIVFEEIGARISPYPDPSTA